MNARFCRSGRYGTVTMFALAFTGVLHAAGVWADEELDPRAVALLEKFVEVTGGEAAYAAVATRAIQGQLVMPARGLEASMVTFFVRPDKFYTEINSPAGVQLRRGSNGSTAWMIEPAYGARILRGAERVSMVRDSTPDRFGHWREITEKLEYGGEEELNGKRCAKVTLTYKPLDNEVQEPPVTVFFDLATGLVCQYTATMVRPQIHMSVTVELDDYRKVDDLLLPFTLKMTADGIESQVTLTSVQNNVEVPDKAMRLPEDIQRLWVQGK